MGLVQDPCGLALTLVAICSQKTTCPPAQVAVAGDSPWGSVGMRLSLCECLGE